VRLFIGGTSGLVLYEDEDISRLSSEPVLCVTRPAAGRLVAGTESGKILLWDGNGDARPVAKDLGDHVTTLATSANGTVFAGTFPAGGWASKDGGETWAELTSFAKAPGSEQWTAPWGAPLTSTIACHPKDPKTVYCGVEVGGVYRSRDAGKKWFDLEIPNSDVHAIRVSPAKHERVYVVTGKGGFSSDDEGFNWKPMAKTSRTYLMGLAAHPAEADRVIVSAADGPPPTWKRGVKCDVYLSTDAGRRFRTVSKGLKGVVQRKALVINLKVPSEVVFGTSAGDLWYSNDGGEFFYTIAEGLGDVKAIAFA
jgi:photosystem II stability/assembly factor-like uncharacterized protein